MGVRGGYEQLLRSGDKQLREVMSLTEAAVYLIAAHLLTSLLTCCSFSSC